MVTSSLSELFVVDADSHWSEPADLFTRLAPTNMKDRVPHHETIDGKRMWVMDGETIGQAAAGAVIGADGKKAKAVESLSVWHVEDAHAGASDPKARIAVLDEFGINAQVIFPSTIGLGGQDLGKTSDHSVREMSISIYNDGMAEIQEQSGNRLLPMPLMPAWDVDLSVAEAKRVAGLGAPRRQHDLRSSGPRCTRPRQPGMGPVLGNVRGAAAAGALSHRRQHHRYDVLREVFLAISG